VLDRVATRGHDSRLAEITPAPRSATAPPEVAAEWTLDLQVRSVKEKEGRLSLRDSGDRVTRISPAGDRAPCFLEGPKLRAHDAQRYAPAGVYAQSTGRS
jgi:hypothetical protein